MSRLEDKIKKKDPPTKGAATPANGPYSELDNTNIERKSAKRFLSWTCVVYPGESLPENWKDILGELMIPWAISPLHDEDMTEDGEIKKAHRHLLLSFYTVKSYAQIEQITRRLGAPSPQVCKSVRGMVRYFLHLDSPDKAQYKREDIEFGGGFDLENALKATATEEQQIINEIRAFIKANWVTDFCDLDSYVLDEREEWATILSKKWAYFGHIIKSQRHKTIASMQKENEKTNTASD